MCATGKFEYEFGGPIGAFMTMVSLPVVIIFLYLVSDQDIVKGADLRGIADLQLPDPETLFSSEALVVCLGWLAFLVACERQLPGKVVKGVQLPPAGPGVQRPSHLEYRMNGHLSFWMAIAGAALFFDLSYIYDNYLQLAVASIIISLSLSVYLFATSFDTTKQLAEGVSGNALYDFFMGRELNPRIGTFDLKVFCELRPGLIGWMVINLGMMSKQRQLMGHNTWSMIAVVTGQALYIWDSLYYEQAILTTMDVTTDGFGYMLAFGDLAWVPFTYTLQTRYLVTHVPQPEGYGDVIAAVAVTLSLFGYTVFRLANLEKDTFRRNPHSPRVAHLKTMETNRPGKKLLISGWWGVARKINYTGDWLLGLSWSLATGFESIMTYFYPIYFAILLIHRAGRDDHQCRKKYGSQVWEAYKKQVPYMFIPYVI
eukprot:TRINITY_DN9636_c0_g1_i1.p1 TRINITY_DN9636_c0_g1~~TRINITY_DN9636_c0_g1_i1.p1  ORF type:complete len:427 (+),score=183.01 TRINITY_DN9636_c0_g1_i1:162-1442(+)